MGDICGILKYHERDYSSLTSLCYLLTNFNFIGSIRYFTIVSLKDPNLHFGHPMVI